MSFRLEMLQVARLAPNLLGESSALVANFIRSQHNADGGFADRDGRSDVYYTVFGIEGLQALQVEPPWDVMRPYFAAFGDGENLDFVHLCCLIRSLSGWQKPAPELVEVLLGRVEKFRTPDGGYNQKPGARRCSAYGCLLGWSAYADFKQNPPQHEMLTECLAALKCEDGSYANDIDFPLGSTPATAAAVALHRHLRRTPDPALGDWLLRQTHAEGGFLAFADAPLPDLLSTAVALHALDGMQVSFAHIKEKTLDYVDTLWSAEGGFHGNWTDDILDVEYTYYGLLALGHLSL